MEGGYGERLPTIDTRPPRLRDSDAIIEVFDDFFTKSLWDNVINLFMVTSCIYNVYMTIFFVNRLFYRVPKMMIPLWE